MMFTYLLRDSLQIDKTMIITTQLNTRDHGPVQSRSKVLLSINPIGICLGVGVEIHHQKETKCPVAGNNSEENLTGRSQGLKEGEPMIEVGVPEKMKAVQLVGHGDFDKLVYSEDVPVPKPGRGEVLIEVTACGMNNTDVNTRVGWYSKSVTAATGSSGFDVEVDGDATWGGSGLAFPRIQGADPCGEVVAQVAIAAVAVVAGGRRVPGSPGPAGRPDWPGRAQPVWLVVYKRLLRIEVAIGSRVAGLGS